MNTHIPEAYGGMGLGVVDGVLMGEETAWGCTGVSTAIEANTLAEAPVIVAGSEAQKKKYLGRMNDEFLFAAYGVTEPNAGSDVAAIKTTAVRKGDKYIINGEKMWITSGMQADWMCTLVNTSDGHPHFSKSLIIIPMDSPGIERSRKLHKLGMWSSDTAQIFLEDVRVPRPMLRGP